MPVPIIKNGEEHFFPIIYEGNGGGQRVGKFVPFTDSATIAKSCIFNTSNNDNLSKTYSGTGTSQQTATISAWVKRCKTGNDFQTIFAVGSDNFKLAFNSGTYANAIQMYYYTGSYVLRAITNRTFEDTSKWYHIVFVLDLNNDTKTDRWRLYVDGDRITSFVSSTYEVYPNNTTTTTNVGGADTYRVGKDGSSASYDGYIAEFNYIDGQALLPENFGETDTSTGRWVPSTIRPYPASTETITVTVVSSGGNKYAVARSGYNSSAGVTQGTLNLFEGGTYRFDQSDSSNAGHPLRFSTTSNGTHGGGTEYTTGVTTAGTPGSSGAYTEITVASSAPTLYYYCSNHSGMGGTANTPQSYGVQGTRLEFGTSSAMGDDTSGNNNDFTPNTIDATNQTTDSPTQNHMTFGGRTGSSITLSEGNLKVSVGAADTKCITGMGIPTSGKYYWEVTLTTLSTYGRIGVAPADANFGQSPTGDGIAYDRPETAGGMRVLGVDIGSGWDGAFTQGNIMNFALDADNKFLYIGENNNWRNSGDPTSGATGTGGVPYGSTSLKDKILYPSVGSGNAGGTKVYDFNFGQKSLSYTPPTGYVTLQQDNLPETAKGISGLVWTKNRDATDNHQLYDSTRGKQKLIIPTTNAVESTVTDGLQKFLKGGQQIEDNVAINTSGESFVSWNWVANGGTTATNNDGSLTSTVQVNQTAGFSIVQGKYFDGTLGHGLGQTPEWILYKEISPNVNNWFVYHKDLPSSNYYLTLNSSSAQANYGSTLFAPTSTTFATNLTTVTNRDAIAYVWHGVEGFSKFGNYRANNSADGPFVYLGFKPKLLIIKSSGAISWYMIDATRSPTNPAINGVTIDNSQAEFTNQFTIDFLSNGFKIRNSNSGYGSSTNSTSHSPYYYMAFAEHPFVGDGTSPVTAR